MNNIDNTNMYKILSWDVGIKNLAYCILEKQGTDYVVTQWDSINIIDSEDSVKCHMNKCNNPAKYSCLLDDTSYYYCGTHKTKYQKLLNGWEDKYISTEYDFNKCTYINKTGTTCEKKSYYKTKTNAHLCSAHKKSYLNKIKQNYELKEISKKKCKDFTPFEISGKMYSKLDSITELLQVNEVLIENQPALKNPPIKAVGSFLYGYFMMRGIIDKEKTKSNITKVSFISPSNKLKVNKDKTLQTLTKTSSGEKYKMTKKLAVEYTKTLLQAEDKWLKHLDSYKKKDDLCDALLQGYYYMYFKLDKRKSSDLDIADVGKKIKIHQKNENVENGVDNKDVWVV